MTLERQSVNIILYQGIDTKTNQKLVENKLLEMENCEINNQQIVKSPGSERLARRQTNVDSTIYQKGITADDNTLIVANESSLYKYNTQEDVLNKFADIAFSYNREHVVQQNLTEKLKTNTGTTNQLYAPFTKLTSLSITNYIIPQPLSAQYNDFLFTCVFHPTSGTTELDGYYDLNLTNAKTDSQIYVGQFANIDEIPQAAVATPAGVFMYTVNVTNGSVSEYFLSYDLNTIFMTQGTPFNADIFAANPVLIYDTTTVSNVTSYCSFLTADYADQMIWFSFRRAAVSPSYTGYIAVRNLAGANIVPPTAITGVVTVNSPASQEQLNLCAHIFKIPTNEFKYYVVVFGENFYIYSIADRVQRANNIFIGVTGFSTHSIGYLTLQKQLVFLVHDITEFESASSGRNTIIPTVNTYNVDSVSAIELALKPVTGDILGTTGDPRWVNETYLYGTSAIAGRVLCVHDKILFPIFYFAYLFKPDTTTATTTPFQLIHNSAHLVQFVPKIDYDSPFYLLERTLNHISWIKNWDCSVYQGNDGKAIIPTIMKSNMVFDDDNELNHNVYYGFYVHSQRFEFEAQQLRFIHQFNSYYIDIPDIFDFEGVSRGSYYFGSGKLNELSSTSFSEMNFFDYPQISVGGTVAGGTILAGEYIYEAYYKWINGNGDLVNSPVSIKSITYAANIASANVYVTTPPFFSNKLNPVTRVFRSLKNGRIPYFESDLQKIETLFVDNLTDASIKNNTLPYTEGGILPNYPFYSIRAFALYKNAVFVIDANTPNLIRYSLPRTQGTALAYFEGALNTLGFNMLMESRGGVCTYLATMDDKLVIFKEDLIYAVVGELPNNQGIGGSLSDPQLITSPVGCSEPNSVVLIPTGLIFKSKKGIWLLDRSLNCSYIGADVEKYNDLKVTSSKLLTAVNKVKFSTTEGVVLVYDYYYQTWNIELYGDGISDLTNLDDKLTLITESGKIYQEKPALYTRGGDNYNMSFTTGWVKLAGLSGFQRLYKILFLGTYTGSHVIKVSVYYDYDNEPSEYHYFDPTGNLGVRFPFGSGSWGSVVPYAGYADSTYLFRINVRQQKCTAVRVRLEDIFVGSSDQTGDSFKATTINFDIGVKSATAKVASRQQV